MTKLRARWEQMVESGDDSFPKNAAGPVSLVKTPSTLTSKEFEELYREHHALVRSVAYQMTGDVGELDEIVQQSFIKIWKSLASFRNDSKVTSWIYRITTNTALDHIRSRSRRKDLATEIEKADQPNSTTPEREAANRDLVLKGLMALSPDHRTVLVLAFLHELPLSEVAQVLELSEGTVKSRLHYAKAAFRTYLAKNGVEL